MCFIVFVNYFLCRIIKWRETVPPKGKAHSFKNVGQATGKLVMITMPSGLEKFFKTIHEASLHGRPDKETFANIMRLHNIEPA